MCPLACGSLTVSGHSWLQKSRNLGMCNLIYSPQRVVIFNSFKDKNQSVQQMVVECGAGVWAHLLHRLLCLRWGAFVVPGEACTLSSVQNSIVTYSRHAVYWASRMYSFCIPATLCPLTNITFSSALTPWQPPFYSLLLFDFFRFHTEVRSCSIWSHSA